MTHSRAGVFVRRGLGLYVPLAITMVIMLFPFYWMIITSLKSDAELFDFTKNLLWVRNPSLGNYFELFESKYFLRWFWNSVLTSTVVTLFSLMLSVMAGYALARLRFVGVTLLGIVIFVTYLVPKTFLFIPLAQLLNQMGVLGEPLTLFLTYPTFTIPFCTWLLTGYFRTIPVDLEECARIDGCSRLGAICRIALPLSVPGILTAGIFAFTLSWNELLYTLVFVNGEANKTLPLGVTSVFIFGDSYFWGPLMAAATLASIPVAILYFAFFDLYVGGLTAGAVKG